MVQVDESKPGRKDLCDLIDHWSLILSPALFVLANVYLAARNYSLKQD
jgi:hypothetical protein